jgi:ribosomal protein RSM22 (predicted rRNA methylase)
VVNLPEELRAALDSALEGVPPKQVSAAAGRLIERYRQSTGSDDPLVSSDLDVLAYAAYRMPATFAAIRSALRRAAVVVP